MYDFCLTFDPLTICFSISGYVSLYCESHRSRHWGQRPNPLQHWKWVSWKFYFNLQIKQLFCKKGINFFLCLYYFVLSFYTDTNAPDLFQIDEKTGEISVKTKFDREELLGIGATVTLHINVSLLTNEFDCVLLSWYRSDYYMTANTFNFKNTYHILWFLHFFIFCSCISSCTSGTWDKP